MSANLPCSMLGLNPLADSVQQSDARQTAGSQSSESAYSACGLTRIEHLDRGTESAGFGSQDAVQRVPGQLSQRQAVRVNNLMYTTEIASVSSLSAEAVQGFAPCRRRRSRIRPAGPPHSAAPAAQP